MYGLIYKATNIENRKIYIGQTTRSLFKRKTAHYSSIKIKKYMKYKFSRALQKYSKDKFKWEVLGYCNSKEELNEAEIICIEFFNSMNDLYGYNMVIGGYIGNAMNRKGKTWEEQYGDEKALKLKRKRSNDAKNWIRSDGYKEKLRIIHTGKKLTEETKKKMSDSRKGKRIGEKNTFYGKKHSEESKQKISKANKGENSGNVILTEEQVRKIKYTAKYKKVKKGYWKKLAKELNIDKSTISNIITNRKWKHVEV